MNIICNFGVHKLQKKTFKVSDLKIKEQQWQLYNPGSWCGVAIRIVPAVCAMKHETSTAA